MAPGLVWVLGPEPAWPPCPFRKLHSAKRGEGFCPEGVCQAPTPAVFSSVPQPCRTVRPSGGHSIVPESSHGQLTPLLPPASRANLPLCLSRCYGPEEVAGPMYSPTMPSIHAHSQVSPASLNKVDACPEGRSTRCPLSLRWECPHIHGWCSLSSAHRCDLSIHVCT